MVHGANENTKVVSIHYAKYHEGVRSKYRQPDYSFGKGFHQSTYFTTYVIQYTFSTYVIRITHQ